MIKSMTAFASIELFEFPFRIVIEARSYNSKFLDILLKLSHDYRSIEEDIRRLITKKVTRGRIEVNISIKNESDSSYRYDVNIPKAKAYFKALSFLNRTFDLGGVNLSTLINISGIIQPEFIDKCDDKIKQLVNKSIDIVILEMDKMKMTEGNNLAYDLSSRLHFIESILDDIESNVSDFSQLCRDRLKERVEKLTNGLIEIDNERLIHEVSVMSSKSDISEEIIRCRSHIKQFRSIMNGAISSGKKLNFLLQEFFREFNTMSSKVGKSEVSYMIISVKSELEKMREQIQNVE